MYGGRNSATPLSLCTLTASQELDPAIPSTGEEHNNELTAPLFPTREKGQGWYLLTEPQGCSDQDIPRSLRRLPPPKGGFSQFPSAGGVVGVSLLETKSRQDCRATNKHSTFIGGLQS